MCVGIQFIFRHIILLTCKSDNTILVQEDIHGVDHCSDQDIDPEIVLVVFPEGRLLNILLNYD